jgi:hypothetical protein
MAIFMLKITILDEKWKILDIFDKKIIRKKFLDFGGPGYATDLGQALERAWAPDSLWLHH